MTDPAADEPRYLIMLDLGATAGPYTLQELREQVETGRAGPDDRIVSETTRQGMKLAELILDAAEIHGRRKSDRIRKRSDRLAAVQASEARKSDRLVAVAVAAEAKKVSDRLDVEQKKVSDRLEAAKSTTSDRLAAERKKTSDRLAAERRRTSEQLLAVDAGSDNLVRNLTLAAIGAIIAAVIVVGLELWDGAGDAPKPVAVEAVLGTWILDPAVSGPDLADGAPPAVVAKAKEDLEGLKLHLAVKDGSLTTKGGTVSGAWRIVANGGNQLAIEWTGAHPVLGQVIVLSPAKDALRLEAGPFQWRLKRAP